MSTRTTEILGKGYEGADRRGLSAAGISWAGLQEKAVEKYGIALFLGMLILFVATLSVAFLSKQSIRLDEAQSLWQTGRTPVEILYTVSEDVHVPFYHLVLRFWRLLAGETIAAARLLSLLFFLVSIPAIYHLGRTAFGRTNGMFAAFLLAVSPFLNWYGNEARMYSLMVFLTILNQYFFLRIFREPKRAHWIGYAITAVLGIYTHYFFAFVLLAQAIFYIIYRSDFTVGSLRKFIWTAAAVVLSLAPWLIFVATRGAASNTRPQLDPPTTVNLFNTFSQFVFGFQTDHLNTIIVSLWPLAVLLGFFALRRNRNLAPETVYFILGMTVPIVAAFALSFTVTPVYVARYLILALPSMYLFISWLFSIYPQRMSYALKTFLLVAMVMTLAVQTVSAETPVKEEYREAVHYLNRNVRPQDVVILSAPFTVYPVEYYYMGPAAVRTLPIWDRYERGPIPPFIEERLPAEVERLKGTHQRAFLLLSYDQGYEDEIREYFDTHFERLERHVYSPGLSLYVYKLRYDQLETANAFRRTISDTPDM